MISDPLFIIGILGMTLCLITWIRFNINDQEAEPFVIKYLSSISFISGIALLLSIFYNSGDLGIVLLAFSIIALIVMICGYYYKNTEIISTSRGYLIPIFVIFVLRTFLYEPYQIPSGSMEPQLKKGDFLLVNKYAYGIKVNRIGIPKVLKKDPQYGDPVVIIPPHNPVPYIKRLIGKPGDVVRIINKQVYVNGIALKRSFIDTEEIILKRRFKYSSGEIINLVKKIDKELIKVVKIFDVYQGDNIVSGKKSIAFSVTLEPKDKTLSDNDIEETSKKIISTVQKTTGATLRS